MAKRLLTTLLSATLLAGAAGLSACGNKAADASAITQASSAALDSVLTAQPEASKERYQYRNPKETLEFIGITPGMKVVEALPGGSWNASWYSKVLAPYLGSDGMLYGADYSLEMWPHFGGFATPEFIESKKTWGTDWSTSINENAPEGSAKAAGFTFSTIPAELNGTIDAVLFIRALHNMSRFEDKGGYMASAIASTYDMLKPGGIVGVVQHRAPADVSDDWANGSKGYLKQANLIAAFEAAGFKLAGTSEVNANAMDMPGADDIVWRLPPSMGTTRASDKDTAEKAAEKLALRAKMKAIGESDRMTLKFVKR